MKEQTKRLCVTAVLLALAAALSTIKLFTMPFGGTVTPASMLPVCLIAVLYHTEWGVLSGLLYGVMQLILGLNNLSYATSAAAAAAIIMLDYLLAFAALGISDLFRFKPLGVIVACLLRFLCHFVTGFTVWSALSPDAVWYSLLYNGAYMLPETVITAAAMFLLCRTGVTERLRKLL